MAGKHLIRQPRACCDECGDVVTVVDPDAFENAVTETNYGNLDEALACLAAAIPALDGLPALVAKELARRDARKAAA